MADNVGVNPYDYKDYYTGGRYPPAVGVNGSLNETAPGMSMGEKWRGSVSYRRYWVPARNGLP